MNHNIMLALAAENEIPYLKEKMAESFSIAVREHFGDNIPEGGPPAEQLEYAARPLTVTAVQGRACMWY